MSEVVQPKVVTKYLEERAGADLSPKRLLSPYQLPRRAVITAVDMMGALGTTTEENWAGLTAGLCGISLFTVDHSSVHGPVDLSEISEIATAGIMPDIDVEKLTDGVVPMKKARRMHLAQKMSAVMTYRVMKAAGIFKPDMTFVDGVDPWRLGIIPGSGVAGMLGVGDVAIEIQKGENKVELSDILSVIPERIASVPSMMYKTRGTTFELAAACASGSSAINRMYEQILLGNMDMMVGGGLEAAVGYLAARLFEVSRSHTKSKDKDVASLPFDERHEGFVLANGGAMLAMEELGHAVRRGAKILAEVVGYGDSMDAGDSETAPNGIGAEIALRKTIYSANRRVGTLTNNEKRYVNSHGTGTQVGDLMENEVISRTMEDVAPGTDYHTAATKSMTGHMSGGAGAYEAAICILGLATGVFPGTINRAQPMVGSERSRIIDRTIEDPNIVAASNLSLGFGGMNAMNEFRKFPQDEAAQKEKLREVERAERVYSYAE